MTQIATTGAILGGLTLGTGKGSGMKPGAGSDFAAMVAGLGQTNSDTGTVDAEGFALAADTGADADAGTDADTAGGKTGEPVILDLALGAAAQSAVVDMVVAPPAPTIVPPSAGSLPYAAPTSAAPPTRAGLASNGKEALSAAHSASAISASAIVAGQPALGQKRAGKSELSSVPTATPASTSSASGVLIPAGTTETVPTLASGTVALRSAKAEAGIAGPLDTAVVGKGALPATTVPTDGSLAMPVRQGGGYAAASAALPTAPEAGPPLPAIPAQFRQMADTLAPAVTDGAHPLAAVVSELRQTAPGPLASDLPNEQAFPAEPRQVRPHAASVAFPAVPASAASVSPPSAPTIPDQAAYGIQPVMSALHRAVAVPVDSLNSEPVPMAVATGESTRRNAGSASDTSDNGSGRNSGGAALGGDAVQASAMPVDSMAGSFQFADIIQNLPPIAQNRIGGIGESAPVVAGSVDVGATLQGQVIDMTVGGQWIDRVAAEITALAEGKGHSRFQLSPPNLGRIQIDVWQGDNGGRVQLLTETDEAAKRLREGQSSLQSDARLAALQLGSIIIDKAATGFDTPRDQGNAQNNQQNGQAGSQRQHQPGSEQGSQTGGQANQQNGNQQNGQTGPQAGMQGGNSGGQGKSSSRRDVLNHQADIVNQQGGTTGRDGDRLVRYA